MANHTEYQREFWRYVSAARTYLLKNDSQRARRALERAARLVMGRNDPIAEARLGVVRGLASANALKVASDIQSKADISADTQDQRVVSIVTACRNRNDNLIAALPSWLECPEVGEVVVIDFTSERPVRADLEVAGIDDDRIRVVRVDNEPRWVLSRAFNLGFQKARLPYVLKSDADICLRRDFFERNPLAEDGFVAGNWRAAEQGQGFINGTFLVSRMALLKMGGFNEYITSYGWDDEELYLRLTTRGLNRYDVAPHSLTHIEHDDHARTNAKQGLNNAPAAQSLLSQTQFLIRRNRYIANNMPEWGDHRPHAEYEVSSIRSNDETVSRIVETTPEVPESVIAEANLAAARELMSWQLGDECMRLDLPAVAALISSYPWPEITLEKVRGSLASRVSSSPLASNVSASRAAVIVDAQHGLGNRLRAIASAAAVARSQSRELVIVWRPDHHCECRFTDLFAYDGEVLDSFDIDDAVAKGAARFNYMDDSPNSEKGQLIQAKFDQDIYFRSAYVMNHPASTWEAENQFLRGLDPVPEVSDLVASVRSPNEVSMHIRMGGGTNFDHLPWEAPDNWSGESHNLIAHWRQKSHVNVFEARLDALIDDGIAQSVFVAADIPETYDRLKARYGTRIAYLPRPVNDRSHEQLLYAVADAILLGRRRHLLASSWSSFSELALRLAPHSLEAEFSGTNF